MEELQPIEESKERKGNNREMPRESRCIPSWTLKEVMGGSPLSNMTMNYCPSWKPQCSKTKQLEVRVNRQALLCLKHHRQVFLAFMDMYTGKSILCAQGKAIWGESTILAGGEDTAEHSQCAVACLLGISLNALSKKKLTELGLQNPLWLALLFLSNETHENLLESNLMSAPLSSSITWSSGDN